MVNHLRRGGVRRGLNSTSHQTRAILSVHISHTWTRAFGSRFNVCVVFFAQNSHLHSSLSCHSWTLMSAHSLHSGPHHQLLYWTFPHRWNRAALPLPLRSERESGRMADWTSNTGYEPNIGLNPKTELTTICNRVDNYQEKASLSFSDQAVQERSQSSKPQICSKHSTDSDWYQCRLLLETSVWLCFWNQCVFSFNKTQETRVKICVHDRWIDVDRQKEIGVKVSANPWEIEKICTEFSREKLNQQFDEKMRLRENF